MSVGARAGRRQRILAIWYPQINSFSRSNLAVTLRRHQGPLIVAILARARIVISLRLVLRAHACGSFHAVAESVGRRIVVSWSGGILGSFLFAVPEVGSLCRTDLAIYTFARPQGIVGIS